jgi:hypothetical protein
VDKLDELVETDDVVLKLLDLLNELIETIADLLDDVLLDNSLMMLGLLADKLVIKEVLSEEVLDAVDSELVLEELSDAV